MTINVRDFTVGLMCILFVSVPDSSKAFSVPHAPIDSNVIADDVDWMRVIVSIFIMVGLTLLIGAVINYLLKKNNSEK